MLEVLFKAKATIQKPVLLVWEIGFGLSECSSISKQKKNQANL